MRLRLTRSTEREPADHKRASQSNRTAAFGRAARAPLWMTLPSHDMMIQPKLTVNQPNDASAPPIVHQTLQSPGHPLSSTTRASMESRFGHDFGDVRIHTDGQANESAQAVNAQAYTVGNNIVFGAGRYSPDSSAGQRLMAHELTHVVQQAPGLQRQPATAPTVTSAPQRGTNPATCMTVICNALATPTTACLNAPQACAQTWITDVMNCLTPLAAASNATNHQHIINNTRQELSDEVSAMNTRMPNLRTASDRRDYIDWLHSICERKQREIGIEFHFNVVFENVSGQPPWAYYTYNWDQIETALAALPEEHLWGRSSSLPPITFRREGSGPATTSGTSVGGQADPATGVIQVYNAGMGSQPYTRSQALGLAATLQTLRHEVGHLVEATLPTSQVNKFFSNVVDWRQYSWAWITTHPAAYASWRKERENLCRDLNYLDAKGQCDQTRLSTFLTKVAAANQTVNGREYVKGDHHLASWPVGHVPSDIAFQYGRTDKGEYFAELYALATSTPEFLHQQLPAAQINWLKQHVFDTQTHYNQIIGPYTGHLAVASNDANFVHYQTLLRQADRVFTRQQLVEIGQQLQSTLQQMVVGQGGGQLA